MYYFADLIDKTQCIGNSLSTINLDLSSLDLALYETDANLLTLSTYHLALDASTTVRTDYLSSQIITVSSNLLNTIKTVSAGAPSFYQRSIYPTGSSVNYDFDTYGSNVKTEISSNLYFDNISNISQGEFGKILLKVYPTSGVSITGWGNQWTFSNTSSTFNFNASAYNLIDYYYSDSRIFAQVASF